jgi:predicted RNA-binding protein YlxR (DUF448 family)
MKQRKIPLRTCVITKESLPKNELLRVVRTPEGDVKVDETGKLNGRGAYIKKDIEVLNTAKKNKALEKALEVSINDEVYDELEKIINKREKKIIKVLKDK